MPLGTAARELAAKGFAVFPLRPKTKEPYGDDRFFRTVGGYKSASRDPALIEFWWSRQPNANIGLATGSVSGVWVLDLDGDDDEAWLAAQQTEHGERLRPTVEVTTGKGRHLYFRYPLGVDIRNVQDRDDIPDVRGNGGYVLVPPSVHPSGCVYAWSGDASEFADAPPWLTKAVTKHRNGTAAPVSPTEVRSFIGDTHSGSRRGRAVARLSGILLRKYLDPLVALDMTRLFNAARCDPPLADAEVVRIVTDITRLEQQRRERRP